MKVTQLIGGSWIEDFGDGHLRFHHPQHGVVIEVHKCTDWTWTPPGGPWRCAHVNGDGVRCLTYDAARHTPVRAPETEWLYHAREDHPRG